MTAPHVVVACDKFKGSLTAHEVIAALDEGLRAGAPEVAVRSAIIADGGDGTLDAAYQAGYRRVPFTCAGPTGEPVQTSYAVLPADSGRPEEATVVIEMADACGLNRLPGGVLAPLTASSRGLGQVIRAALDEGYRRLVIGIGGSASTDGGAGMLAALGVRLLDVDGDPVPEGGGGLEGLASVDLSGLHPAVADASITVACDVDNPLLGARGAPAIFGPQKGCTPDDIAHLDVWIGRLAALVAEQLGRDEAPSPGAGAAGGVGWAALSVLGARMRPGIELVLEFAHFDALVAGARLVVTGEGSLDQQTLLGKAPAGVAAAARRAGVPVVAVCGRALLTQEEAREAGFEAVYALTDLEPDPAVCMRDAGRLLRELAERVARERLAAG